MKLILVFWCLESRHACEQGDDLAGYGWKTHDGRTSGQHYVNDVLNNVRIESELLKVEGGAHGLFTFSLFPSHCFISHSHH